MAAKKKWNTASPPLRLHRNDSVEFEDRPPLLKQLPPVRPTLGDFLYPDVVSRQACFWGGLVFGFIGAIESMYPTAGGDYAARYLGLFYLVAGAALVLPAMVLPPRPLARVSVALGVFFAVLGFAGFLLGAPPESPLSAVSEGDRFHWVLWPGNLEFGTKDHVLQEIIGLTLVAVGWTRRARRSNGLLDMTIK